ncbi:ACT domain-containing protein [Brevibacillus sp. SYSU BS000544]|uniref:ACT domain-containing protein n=1 Tax=Brevibacillus sp. SYSU BS000544 TaxID=3416443 RepID=UPI003CE50309
MKANATFQINNGSDVLLRVITIFTRYESYIEACSVVPDQTDETATLSIRFQCDPAKYTLLLKQVEKLIDVIETVEVVNLADLQ